ncbi:right-handed parallel beta-helix repeat-containing protein, partial [Spirosoma lituiforme]
VYSNIIRMITVQLTQSSLIRLIGRNTKKGIGWITLLLVCLGHALWAQVIYVDALKGDDQATGSVSQPVASLHKAVQLSYRLSGEGDITIKLAPGLYVLSQLIKIQPSQRADTTRFTLEALVMPDDPAWKPASMPVIQSISANNLKTYFEHCAGLEILRNRVSIRGVKFVGNANPSVEYYYPIERDSANLKDLTVSQCLFIGERNWAPIQGAVYMEGANTVQVDHCIFYHCKNALLLFYSAKGFSLTHSIIDGAYESAIWYGYKKEADAPFVFRNNIITGSDYFFLSSKSENHPLFTFSNSVITGNVHYMGVYDSGQGPTPYQRPGTHQERGIRKTGKVVLNQVTPMGIPSNYLHPTAQSAGYDLGAGLFRINPKK